jgi:hypothetical protein
MVSIDDDPRIDLLLALCGLACGLVRCRARRHARRPGARDRVCIDRSRAHRARCSRRIRRRAEPVRSCGTARVRRRGFRGGVFGVRDGGGTRMGARRASACSGRVRNCRAQARRAAAGARCADPARQDERRRGGRRRLHAGQRRHAAECLAGRALAAAAVGPRDLPHRVPQQPRSARSTAPSASSCVARSCCRRRWPRAR